MQGVVVPADWQHPPSWQVSLPDVRQSLPHAPQLSGSSNRLTHSSPHRIGVLGLPQMTGVVEQDPALHVAPAAQVLPHPPQFFGSVRKFVHALPHLFGVPPLQVDPVHEPCWQL